MTSPDELVARFPIEHDGATVRLLGVDDADGRVTITAVVESDDPDDTAFEESFVIERPERGKLGLVRRVPVPPAEIDPAALVANVRHHLAHGILSAAALFEPPAPFQRLAAGAAEDVGGALLAISEQGGALGFDQRFDVVAQWPDEAAALYYAAEVSTVVAGNGFEVLVVNEGPVIVREGFEALERLGCERLVARFREALGLVREQALPLIDELDSDWLDEHAAEPPSTDEANPWHAIDSHEPDGSYTLCAEELPACAAAYLAAHRDVLVAG